VTCPPPDTAHVIQHGIMIFCSFCPRSEYIIHLRNNAKPALGFINKNLKRGGYFYQLRNMHILKMKNKFLLVKQISQAIKPISRYDNLI
jgi:hypothetical protein